MAVRRASLTCCWDSPKATVPMPSIGKEEPLLSFTDLTIVSSFSFSFSFSFSSPPPPHHHLWVEIVATAKYNSPQNHRSGSTQHPKKNYENKKSLKLKDQWWRKMLHHYYNKLPTSSEYSQKSWKCSELEEKEGIAPDQTGDWRNSTSSLLCFASYMAMILASSLSLHSWWRISAFSFFTHKVWPKKEKLQITNSKMNPFWRDSIARSEEEEEEEGKKKQVKIARFLYLVFSVYP